MNKALIAGLLLLVLLSGCIEGNPTYIISEDVNGEDINVGTVFADVIDANAVKANYFVARNYIDANYLGNGFFNKDINVAGTGTFGEIIDNGLTANLGVYTDGSKQLTSTPPTSGVLGYWSRAGTVISTATAGDDITTSGKIYGGTSYSFILGDFDNAIAGFFDNGSGFTATLGTGSGHTFTDGSRTAVLSNGSAAGFFDDGGGRQVTLSGAATAITATDGTHTINIADGSYGVDATGNSYIGRLVDSSNSRAGYFEYSGSYFAELASSNYPFYAYDNSSNYVYMMGNSSYTLEAYNSGKSAAIYGSDGSSNYGQIADGSNAIYGYHGSSNNYGSIGTSSYGIEAYLSSGSAAVYASDGFSNVAQLATGSYPLYVNDTGGNYFYGGGGSSSYVGEFYSADRSAAIYAYDSPTGNYVYLAEGTTNQYSAIYAYKGGSGNYSGVFTDGSMTAVFTNGGEAGNFYGGGSYSAYLARSSLAGLFDDGSNSVTLVDSTYSLYANRSSTSYAGYFAYGSMYAALSGSYPGEFNDGSSNYCYVGGGSSSYSLECYSANKSAAVYGSDSSSNYGTIADGSTGLYGYYNNGNYGSVGSNSYGVEAYLSSGSAAVYASDGFSNVAQLATGSYPLYVNDTGGNYFYGGGGSSSYVGEFYSADRSAAIYAYDSPTGNYVYLAEGTTNQYSAIYAYKGGSGNYSGVFTDGSMTAVFTNGGEAGNFYGGGSYSAYLARSSLAGLFDDGSNSVTLVDSTYSLYANRSSTSYAGYFAYGSMYAALSGSYPGEFNDGSSNYCYVGGGSSSYSLECYSANKSAAVYGSDSSSNYGTIADGSTGLYGYYNNGNYGSVGSNSYGVEAYLSSGSAAVYAYDSSSNYVNLVDGSYSLYANSNSLTAAAYLTNGNNYGEIGHGNYASYFYNSGTGDHVYLAENSSYNAAIYAVRSGGVYAGWFVDGTRQAYFASSNEAGYFSGSGGNSVSLGDGTYALNISGNSITTGNVIIDSDSSQLQLGDDQDMFLFSDAVNTLNFEGSTADTDLEFYFTGSSYSGTMWWQEDENKFHFDQTISTDGDGNIGGNANVGGTLYVDGNYGAFGEMWQKNSAIVLGLPAQDVYYQVDDWNVGDFYNTELNPDQNCIDAKQSGMYLMSLSISYTGSANTTFHFKIFKNGVGLEHCHVENKSGAGAEGAVPITCLERLIADTDQVGVRVEQETGANKVIQISSANLNIARVG